MRRARGQEGEQGFALIAMVVAIFVVLLMLGVAAQRVAKELKRDREVEAMHRGDQYVRAVRVFYRKNGSHYPGSIEQLEKTNNVRFLRQQYVDPLTGKPDWRIIHVGEAKTTVKGFFGQPLAGIATTSLGSAAGLASPGIGTAGAGGVTAGGTAPGSGFGTSSGFGASPGGLGSSGFGASTGGLGSASSGTGGAGTATTGTAATGAGGTTGAAAGSTDAVGGSGPFVGVGSSATGDSILDLNDQTTYETWEFIYDPRIEQLYAKANLMGGGASTSAGGLGSASGNQSPGIGTGPAAPGSSNSSGSYNPNAPSSPSSPGSPTSPFSTSPTR